MINTALPYRLNNPVFKILNLHCILLIQFA